MTAQLTVCRLCCDTVKREDTEIINESVIEMLQTLLVRIDLTISENPLICTTCRKKLEQHYNFKKKCIFTEESITPFVAENVKINLKEIRSQIIKAEELEDEDDHNVCRLCLEFIDHDMMLNDFEKEQFQQFFPEVDLSRTSFVVLCSTCYDFLHKYFIFVTSCMELEQQLCNYFLDQSENKIDLTEEKCSIKLDDFQEFVKSVKEVDEKKDVVLNEELDIKCDTEGDDERYVGINSFYEPCDLYSNTETVFNETEHSRHLNDSTKPKKNITTFKTKRANDKKFKCKECGFESKNDLRLHILSKHTDPSKVMMYKCDLCRYETKLKKNLKRHHLIHKDPAQIVIYKCTQCNYQSKFKSSINRHVKFAHVDPSQLDMYACEYCNRLFKHQYNLKKHTSTRHTQVVVHKCDKCEYNSLCLRSLKDHILNKHTDVSEVKKFTCDYCSSEFKKKHLLRDHIAVKHAKPSDVKLFKCIQCSHVCKRRTDLKNHVLAKHTEDSEVELHKCNHCHYTTKIRKHLNRHIAKKHINTSLSYKHKCVKCDYKGRQKIQLTKHLLKHPECMTST